MATGSDPDNAFLVVLTTESPSDIVKLGHDLWNALSGDNITGTNSSVQTRVVSSVNTSQLSILECKKTESVIMDQLKPGSQTCRSGVDIGVSSLRGSVQRDTVVSALDSIVKIPHDVYLIDPSVMNSTNTRLSEKSRGIIYIGDAPRDPRPSAEEVATLKGELEPYMYSRKAGSILGGLITVRGPST